MALNARLIAAVFADGALGRAIDVRLPATRAKRSVAKLVRA